MSIADTARLLAGRIAQQLVRVSLLEMATRLAAQAFLAVLPMLIAIASFSPEAIRRQLLSSLHTLIGTGGPVVSETDRLTAGGDAALHQWGAAGVLVAVLSATAFTRALQRMCERAWELPHASLLKAAWRWAVWLVVWITVLILQGILHRAFGAGPGLGVPLQLAAAVLMWWWTQHLLLIARVGWRPLLPGALLTGSGVIGFCSLSAVWLPRTLRMSQARYGALGSVFSLLSWLILLFTVVVFGIAVGRVLVKGGVPGGARADVPGDAGKESE
ncbi:YhjD/YihY/BrkB family envelope integrity protein [Phaeacidiphilus oryzae]|uniref:YhjD/YihY/BrkB family envelope integrity protein n=1 Tax=Phaeacidiphilus oryzae TaxID=348818 RepID=UPI0007C63AEF|nr:YhjD/YihY/BrkB family envelope integrity protein [Phaeacidiphilus oryzae]